MTTDQIERQTKDLIKRIARDESAGDVKRLAAKLRDIAFQVEVAAQELERTAQ